MYNIYGEDMIFFSRFILGNQGSPDWEVYLNSKIY